MARKTLGAFEFKKHDHIGALEAEEDSDFLSECFVDNGYLRPLLDLSNPKRILVGRTGSGKSALIGHILRTQDGALRVEPERMALEHLHTTTILGHLTALDVRMDVFFKLLWKHTIIIALLRRRFGEGGYFFPAVKRYFDSRKYPLALRYLEDWAGKFWNEENYGMKSITQSFIDRLEDNDELSLLIHGAGLSTSGSSLSEVSSDTRSEIRRVAQDIINKSQVRELGQVLSGLNEVFDDSQKPQYVCVDGLDENWASPELRYQLVKALIQVAREFRACRYVKPIIVIRTDLMQRVFRDTRYAGEQHEKYAALSTELAWTRDELEDVLDRRVDRLVARRYASKAVAARDLLPRRLRVGRDKVETTGVDYVIDRSLLRPRDVIRFMNACIALSDNCPTIGKANLLQAEATHSSERVTALCDEWSGEYPFLRKVLGDLVSEDFRATGTIRVREISNDALMNMAIVVSEAAPFAPIPLVRAAEDFAHDLSDSRSLEFTRQILVSLFTTGAVGLKLDGQSSYVWTSTRGVYLAPTQIVPKSRIRIHRMLCTALGIHQ